MTVPRTAWCDLHGELEPFEELSVASTSSLDGEPYKRVLVRLDCGEQASIIRPLYGESVGGPRW